MIWVLCLFNCILIYLHPIAYGHCGRAKRADSVLLSDDARRGGVGAPGRRASGSIFCLTPGVLNKTRCHLLMCSLSSETESKYLSMLNSSPVKSGGSLK